MSTHPTTVVIGGGIAGCACAIELARRGVPVTLLEQDQPGVHATGASGGMLAPQYEAGEKGPVFELLVQARDNYPEFVRTIESLAQWPIGYRRDGMLVANRNPQEERSARRMLVWQHALGLNGAVIDGSTALELHPGISRELHSWLWLPDEAQVDSQRLAVALAAAVQAAGAHVRHGVRVTELLESGGSVIGVRTATGDVVRSDVVVLAGGAWSSTILGLPRALPVRPVRGQILRIKPLAIPSWRLVATHDAKYLVPRENGTMLIGSTMEEAGFDENISEARLPLAEHAASLIPALADAPIVEAWAGLRPLTPDAWPLVGPDPAVQGLHYACGHGRNGILLGPLTGRAVAELVCEGASDVRWQSLRADRFPDGGHFPVGG